MKRRTALWIQVAVGYLIPWVFQLSSFFSNRWVLEDGLAKGLFFLCPDKGYTQTSWNDYYSGCSLNLLDQATIGLEGTSLALMTFSLAFSFLSVILYGPDTYDDIDNDEGLFYTFNCAGFYCCSMTLYPITAILILSGCIRFGTLYPTEVLGGSFYLCAVVGCLQLIVILISCFDLLCKSKHEEFVFKTFTGRLYEDCLD